MTQPVPLSQIPFGTTISCQFDLAPVGILISGPQVLSEALVRRLLTPRGRLLDDPDFGYDILDAINDDLGPADVAQIAANIDLEFVKDQRVQASSTTATFVNGALSATTTITAASGPFTLVLTVNPTNVPTIVAAMTPAPQTT